MKQLIIKPILTEKTMMQGGYAFAVNPKASKEEIKKVINNLFNVNVVWIKTIIQKGVTKNLPGKRKQIKTADWKKVVVKLDKDQKIELFDVGQGK